VLVNDRAAADSVLAIIGYPVRSLAGECDKKMTVHDRKRNLHGRDAFGRSETGRDRREPDPARISCAKRSIRMNRTRSMRAALAPMLFDDEDRAGAEVRRRLVIAPARVSESAERKARTQRTEAGHAVHSFQSLLADLATIVRKRIQPRLAGVSPFEQTTRPTALQQQALELLGVRL